jgi:hypothetical protein
MTFYEYMRFRYDGLEYELWKHLSDTKLDTSMQVPYPAGSLTSLKQCCRKSLALGVTSDI